MLRTREGAMATRWALKLFAVFLLAGTMFPQEGLTGECDMRAVRLLWEKTDSVREQPAKAISYLEQASRSCPEDPRIHANLGVLYHKARVFSKAEKAFAAASELAPSEYLYWNNLAWSRILQDKGADALDAAQKAAKLKRDLPEVQDTLAHAQWRAGKYEASMETIRQANQQWPSEKFVDQSYQELRDNYLREQAARISKGFADEGLSAMKRLAEYDLPAAKAYLMSLIAQQRYQSIVDESRALSTTFPNENLVELADKQLAIHIEQDFNATPSEARLGFLFPLSRFFNNNDAFAFTNKKIDELYITGTRPNPITLVPEEPIHLPREESETIPKGRLKRPNSVAYLIANQNYSKHRRYRDKEFAQQDMAMVKKYLIQLMGFEERNVITRHDLTFLEMKELIDDLKTLPPVEEFFFYYVGHGLGAKGSNGGRPMPYFVPVNANPVKIAKQGIAVETVVNAIKQVDAKRKIVVLECCYTGDIVKGTGGAWFTVPEIDPAASLAAKGKLFYFAASTFDQPSWALWKNGQSLFTHYFLKGISGEADSDKPDKKITFGELKKYLRERIPIEARQQNIRQTPVIEGTDDGFIFSKI